MTRKHLSIVNIIALLVAVSIPCFADQQAKYSDSTNNGYKGKVKSVTYTSYDVTDSFGEEVKEVQNTYMTLFNERGNYLEEPILGEKDKQTGKRVYSYDDKGFRKSTVTYDLNGLITEKQEFACDASGNTVEQSVFANDGSMKQKIQWTYNQDGRKLTETRLDSTGAILNKLIYKYDNKGNQVESCEYGSSGSLREKTVNEYASNGKLAYEYHYDSDGSSLIKRCKYSYDADGLLSSKTTETADMTVSCNYTYEKGKKGLISSFEQNKVQSGYVAIRFNDTITYDSAGNKISDICVTPASDYSKASKSMITWTYEYY